MEDLSRHYIHTLSYLMDQTVIYMKERGEQFCKELNINLTLDQLIALDTIWANPGICQHKLSQSILKERSYTGRLVGELQKMGFIERKTSEQNYELVNELYLTQAGEIFIRQNVERMRRIFENIFSDMSDEEIECTKKNILKMKDCMSKHVTIQI